MPLSTTVRETLPADRCVLQNRVFSLFSDIAFQRSDGDGTPLMTLTLGDSRAAIPLGALQREFAIEDDSPDGQMLGLIMQSLDYVDDLRPGDALPREIVDGGASWEPDETHRETARARLRGALIRWLDTDRGGDGAAAHNAVQRLAADTGLRDQVTTALNHAAAVLDVAGPDDVLALIEQIGEELGYIEALRDRFLVRLRDGLDAVRRVRAACASDPTRAEACTQVVRLAESAYTLIATRFSEIDANTGEILPTLRNVEAQRAFIRANRDWLHRNLRAWEPALRDWAQLGSVAEEKVQPIIARSYQFLAARYMPTQEWQSSVAPRHKAKAKIPAGAVAW